MSDIYHPYDSPNGRDIILNGRRTNNYQNATFCQGRCSYLGMNYNILVTNFLWDSSLFQKEEKIKRKMII